MEHLEHLRMDNAGENKLLEAAIKNDPDLNIIVEYTPRDSPQFNGKPERKFAWLWAGCRANLNAALLPDSIRHPLWAASANYTEKVANSIVTARKQHTGSSYVQFHSKEWPPLRLLKPFGTLGVVKTAQKIQSKLKDKGTPMLYLGPAPNHAKDVCRMFNIDTRKAVVTREIVWLDTMYGTWKQFDSTQRLL